MIKPWLLNACGLRAPMDDDFGGGGGSDDDTDDLSLSDDSGDDDDNDDDLSGEIPDLTQPRGKTPAKGTPPAAPTLDADTIGAAIAKGLQAAQPKEKPTQMTDEEYRQKTKYFAVQAEHVKKLFSADVTDEDRMATLQQLLDGAAEHAMMVAAYQQRFAMDDLRKEISPLQAAQQEQRAESFISTVVDQYPVLKNNRQIIRMAAQHVAQYATGPMSPQKAMAEVASVVEAVIKQTIPEFSLAKGRSAKGQMPQMAGSLTGGGGGGSGGGNGRKEKKTFMSLFPKAAR